MNTSEQYHQPVLEALCAFVRDGTKAGIDQRPPATDIQAAITVIGRRAAGTGVVDLYGSHISNAILSGANLSGANLTKANLFFTKLSGADLSGANLTKADLLFTNLSGANLRGTDLSGVDLRGTGTNVSQSQLDHACGDKETRLPSGLTLKTCPF